VSNNSRQGIFEERTNRRRSTILIAYFVTITKNNQIVWEKKW